MKTLSLKKKAFSFLFFSFLFFSPKLWSQDSFRLKVNSVFQNVNKSLVPTQYLMEYGYPFLPLNKFNGVLADSNRTDMTVWRMVYGSLLTSYVGTSTPSLPILSTVNTRIEASEATGAIPISVLYANYNDLRPDAVIAGLLTISNEKLYDVANRTQSPYRNQTVMAAAPSYSESYSAVTQFVFPSNLVLTNITTPYTLSVDFADGLGYRAVSLGTPINVSYANIGTYRIKVKLTPTTGTPLETWFDFQANKALCTTCLYSVSREQILSDPNFLPSSLHSGGKVSFILSVGNTTGKIRKPLIIAKGYDINSVAPHLSKDKDRYTMASFIDGINLDRASYDFNFNLDDIAGYDLVFIDYNDGTDDIKRNALLLQAVIRRVNAEKASINSPEQNVVMGLSMGGLVARFGLAQMVRNGENPQTKLLITHDSPHRGANVPLAFQFMARRIVTLGTFQVGNTVIRPTDIIVQALELRSLLDKPATTQLLMLKATGITPNSVIPSSFLSEGGEYRTMVDNLTTPYRVVATSNGSQCATPLFPPATELINGDAGGFISSIPWVFKSGFRTTVKLNAVDNFMVKEIANWRVYAQIRILGIPINETLYRYTVNCPSVKAFDGAPGGTIGIVNHQTRTSYYWNITFGYSYDYTGQDNFCFIPVGSALDAKNFNSISITEKYVNGINTNNPSNFSRFIAQNQFQQNVVMKSPTSPPQIITVTSFNSRHITFLGRTSRWLFDQMENPNNTTNQECSTECTPSGTISGNTNFCTGTQTYSVNNTTQSPVIWTVSPTNIVTLTPNGNSVNLTKIGNGTVTLSARIGNCNNAIINRTITVGEIYPNFSITELQKPCPNGSQTGIYVANVNSGSNITYSWSCSSCSFVAPYGANNDHVEVGIDYGVTYPVQFTLTAVANGTCGSSNPYSQTMTTSGGSTCDNGGAMMMAISPNPANSQLQLKITDPSLVAQRAAVSYQITILDAYGNIKYANQSPNQNHDISLARLSPGVYSIRVIKGRNILNKTFTIMR